MTGALGRNPPDLAGTGALSIPCVKKAFVGAGFCKQELEARSSGEFPRKRGRPPLCSPPRFLDLTASPGRRKERNSSDSGSEPAGNPRGQKETVHPKDTELETIDFGVRCTRLPPE